ncbi:hypothetical protein IW262DRAFT_1335569 [Armillaria fumosa]|nr:hypothetical protein IW262DRAFT_1335569 [Armillaria fumosa]
MHAVVTVFLTLVALILAVVAVFIAGCNIAKIFIGHLDTDSIQAARTGAYACRSASHDKTKSVRTPNVNKTQWRKGKTFPRSPKQPTASTAPGIIGHWSLASHS